MKMYMINYKNTYRRRLPLMQRIALFLSGKANPAQ